MYALPESCPFRGLFIPNPNSKSDLFNNAWKKGKLNWWNTICN
ncbi:hypothetical protein [Serratia symbiotica]